ncbi:MAG: hypothetical protein B6U72_07615, partial [Candidatus Altiarchaeales archaeon ex4484_2]
KESYLGKLPSEGTLRFSHAGNEFKENSSLCEPEGLKEKPTRETAQMKKEITITHLPLFSPLSPVIPVPPILFLSLGP